MGHLIEGTINNAVLHTYAWNVSMELLVLVSRARVEPTTLRLGGMEAANYAVAESL